MSVVRERLEWMKSEVSFYRKLSFQSPIKWRGHIKGSGVPSETRASNTNFTFVHGFSLQKVTDIDRDIVDLEGFSKYLSFQKNLLQLIRDRRFPPKLNQG